MLSHVGLCVAHLHLRKRVQVNLTFHAPRPHNPTLNPTTPISASSMSSGFRVVFKVLNQGCFLSGDCGTYIRNIRLVIPVPEMGTSTWAICCLICTLFAFDTEYTSARHHSSYTIDFLCRLNSASLHPRCLRTWNLHKFYKTGFDLGVECFHNCDVRARWDWGDAWCS